MILAKDPRIGNDGIFFDDYNGNAFPTVTDTRPYNISEQFSEWLVIARNPRYLSYAEADREAMDETNYAAILESLPVSPVEVSYYWRDGQFRMDDIDAAVAAGIASIDIGRPYGNCLVIAPDTYAFPAPLPGYETERDETLLVDEMIRLRSALADYPLLDEQAYSEREYAAWQDYAPDAWSDEIRDLSASDSDQWECPYCGKRQHRAWMGPGGTETPICHGTNYSHPIPLAHGVPMVGRTRFHPRAIELLTDELEAIDANRAVSVLCPFLAHYAGFDGSYGPSFLSILRDTREPVDTYGERAYRDVQTLRDSLSPRARRVLGLVRLEK